MSGTEIEALAIAGAICAVPGIVVGGVVYAFRRNAVTAITAGVLAGAAVCLALTWLAKQFNGFN